MVGISEQLAARHARPVAVLILCALACCTLAIAFGALATLTYSATYQPIAGLTLQHLRPLHTTFAVAWIYLAAAAVVYAYLYAQQPEPTRGFRWRIKAQLVLWGLAGAGILVSVWLGVFSGREYVGAHWSWSVLIYAGWILFAWNYFSVEGFSLQDKPVYVYMWGTALLLFLWTFAEAHFWMLPWVGEAPLRDIAFQWKSYGTLVGTFNLLVYGSMSWLACCLTRDDRFARSNIAFALLFLGLLNTFTNFGHHTYHLPQTHVVKWISCIVSLAESILVCKYLLNVVSCLKSKGSDGVHPSVRFIVTMASMWSFLLIGIAVVISVPPINALIHGTHFVMGHAMGSMLGIDSMVLWAVLLWIIMTMGSARNRPMKGTGAIVPVFAILNLCILALVVLLSVVGAVNGWLRYLGPVAPAPPRFLNLFPLLLMVIGIGLTLAILYVNISWSRALIPFIRRGGSADDMSPPTEG